MTKFRLEKKYIAILTIFIVQLFIYQVQSVIAGPLETQTATDIMIDTNKMAEKGGFESSGWENSLPAYIANIIKIFLTLLGIIFTVLIIYGGYVWMTAGGSEEKVQKAKDIIQRSVIGFVIILSAYAITYFVFKSIATTSGTTVG